MPPYVKQQWENAPSVASPITAERLNHMEEGIAAAASAENVFTKTEAQAQFLSKTDGGTVEGRIVAKGGIAGSYTFRVITDSIVLTDQDQVCVVRDLTKDITIQFPDASGSSPGWTISRIDETGFSVTLLTSGNDTLVGGDELLPKETVGVIADGDQTVYVLRNRIGGSTGGGDDGGGEPSNPDVLYKWLVGNATPGFARSTPAPYIGPSGMVGTVGAGLPRISKDPSGNLGLMLAPARTFHMTWSDDPSKSDWSKSYMNPPALDTGVAPDGSSPVYRIVPNTDPVATHELRRNVPEALDDTPQTISFIAKAAGYNYVTIFRLDKAGASWGTTINLQDGSIVSTVTQHKIHVLALADGYYWIACTANAGHGGSTFSWRIRVHSGSNPSSVWSGDGVSGIKIWRIAGEANASYPTLGPLVEDTAVDVDADTWTHVGAISGGNVGIAATLYERYYDMSTRQVVEQVTEITSTADIVFATGRYWRELKVAKGSKSLSEMQAL